MGLVRSAVVLAAFAFTGASVAGAQAVARPQPTRTPHALAGRAECLSCHAPGANEHITSAPQAHRFANPACPACHRPAERMPPSPAHAFDASHTTCTTCHVENSPTGAKLPPASHQAYHASICPICHQPAQGG